MNFSAETLPNWENLAALQKVGYAYRGLADFTYKLETSIERMVGGFGWPIKKAIDCERHLLRDFRRHYHHYAKHVPHEDSSLEWMSIMQHHGAPTRLLDFSYSVHVAGFFALEGIRGSQDAVVWRINQGWVHRESALAFPRGSEIRRYILAKMDSKNEKTIGRLMKSTKRTILMGNPFRLNERLSVQKGVFCWPGDVGTRFEDNLKALRGWNRKENVLKIRIPNALRIEGLKSLHYMGISHATLFPGLDGYSRSLHSSMALVLNDVHNWEEGALRGVKV